MSKSKQCTSQHSSVSVVNDERCCWFSSFYCWMVPMLMPSCHRQNLCQKLMYVISLPCHISLNLSVQSVDCKD